ncbi:hypothetical protein DSM100688_1708 [Bifidobacterium ramosum]|uniref:Uncharacterized protein n=2 Tax=Bifidobacterium TaxID=1678 RepID=A0A6L4WZB3_9BIFI|nr:hypothetical protein [Bifidobacterium ramosum]KAB8287349.1 hypothetical protein DSM100688_1708 [Bifidobacterium ramosum]NEG72383.1 hypothetical protein [Bifidobacterium ramosum]
MAIPDGVVPLAEALQGTGMDLPEYTRLWAYFGNKPVAVEGLWGPAGLRPLDACIADGVLFDPVAIAFNVGLMRRGMTEIRRMQEQMLTDGETRDSLAEQIEREWRQEKREEIREMRWEASR